jgi:hypothetical protein
MGIHEELAACVQRELAEFEAVDRAVADGLAGRTRRNGNGSSTVFALRLDRGEVEALNHRAAVIGIKPSVLARNLIRMGLTGRAGVELSDAVHGLETAVAQLRALVP